MKTFVLLIGILGSGCFVDDNSGDFGGGGGGGGPGGGGGGDGGGDGVGVCGEVNCSPKTPDGLRFAGAVPTNSAFPHGLFSDVPNHIANTGTDDIVLQLPADDSELTLPFTAESTSANVLMITKVDGPNISLSEVGGDARLRISDPATGELYDRFRYRSSPFARAVAVGTDEWITAVDLSGSPQKFAFAPGARRVGIAYLNNASELNRLVDTSATITLAGATQSGWDTVDLPNATVGIHTASVHVGDADAMVDIEVVAAIDEVTPLLEFGTFACFGGFKGAAFVSGLAWTFTIDDQIVPSDPTFGPNCVGNPTAPFTVTATAAGKSVTFTTTTQL